ncbi:DUF397 domain-containing protein [Streptomyces carpaticus]|uniref:DUF397 domain-containing protein n=1 Tax=Streptomyces carpaticus TaxID=285558 RepID=A0ABV4ZR62_9ACTN
MWVKPSYSKGQSSCVEVALLGREAVALRDAKGRRPRPGDADQRRPVERLPRLHDQRSFRPQLSRPRTCPGRLAAGGPDTGGPLPVAGTGRKGLFKPE